MFFNEDVNSKEDNNFSFQQERRYMDIYVHIIYVYIDRIPVVQSSPRQQTQLLYVYLIYNVRLGNKWRGELACELRGEGGGLGSQGERRS